MHGTHAQDRRRCMCNSCVQNATTALEDRDSEKLGGQLWGCVLHLLVLVEAI